ncbi:hypothetical protein P3S67_001494 [Capsicum chacoense]
MLSNLNLVKEVEDPVARNLPLLESQSEELRNGVISKHIREPKSRTILARKTLHENFEEPFISAIIAYSPEKIKIFSLMVRNAIEITYATVILSPQVALITSIQHGKG